LFGVYGCLVLALMLFAMREFLPEQAWNKKLLRFSFWAINVFRFPIPTTRLEELKLAER
jgi:nitric oxide reductase large subunit